MGILTRHGNRTGARRRSSIPVATATLLALVLAALPLAGHPLVGAQEQQIPTGRMAGPDRFATAARISEVTFPSGVATAYVATGLAYPDALAGGPVAGRSQGPILLVTTDSLPDPTAAELQRLRPGRIVVLGGPVAVSEAVVDQLRGFTAGEVTRLAGEDRYATAAAISAAGFEPGNANVYVATGENFPDALSGGVAGAVKGGPVLLVRKDEVPETTRAELARLGPERITVLGGTAVVSEQVEATLGELATEVSRVAGEDRYDTAVQVSRHVRPFRPLSTAAVFVATGANFPDALAGAPAAAVAAVPLLLVPGPCMPDVVRKEVARLRPERLVALGETDVVSDAALAQTVCQAPPPTFAVDPQVTPAMASLAPLDDGEPRPLARVVNQRDNGADFVDNELLVVSDDQAALDAFLSRWGGRVVASTDPAAAGLGGAPTHLVRIDPSRTDAGGLAEDVRTLDPLTRGDHRVSSQTGLNLLGAAATEAADGLSIGVNWVGYPDGHLQYADRVAAEAAAGDPFGAIPYSPNPFQWVYMRSDENMNIGVAEAWRALEMAGALGNRVQIAVIDGGFQQNQDLPTNSVGATGTPNALGCGANNACPWHGTNVASVAAAVSDNSRGTAGSAGPIGDLQMIDYDGGMWDAINAVYAAFEAGSRVINMSFSMEVDAAFSFSLIPFEDATQEARERGSLVFASAGNNGEDVDAEDCFFACWEEEWIAPCENDGVVCVGGLLTPSSLRDPGSNYGFESCEAAPCAVDIFGPFTVYVGFNPADPSTDRARAGSGTSYSSPFIAGVAALMWAANPGLTDDQVEGLLYQSAHPSSDPSVGRVVNALGAVLAALGRNIPPVIHGVSPSATTVPYGPGEHGIDDTLVVFSADVEDVEDGDACCTVTWSSDLDGLLVEGEEARYIFKSPGTRKVTATVTDSGGASVTSSSFTVTATNGPPNVSMSEPRTGDWAADVYYRGHAYTFHGGAIDPNEGPLACDRLRWTSSEPTDASFPAQGCHPPVSFATNGARTITLTATDEQGVPGSATVTVDVVDPPTTGPPLVTIHEPVHGTSFLHNQSVHLRGEVHETDAPVSSYRWIADPADDRGPEVIGTQLEMDWIPAHTFPGANCHGTPVTLRLEATDQDGEVGSDEVEIVVYLYAC